MRKALFFDIDGTLVSFQTHSIPTSTIDALERARKNGYLTFISTGRPRRIINNLDHLVFDGYITMNGSFCYAGKEQVIYKCPVAAEDVYTLAEIVDREKITTVFVTEDEMYIVNPGPDSEQFSRMLNVPRLPHAGIEQITDKEIFQVSPFFSQEQENLYMPLLPHSSSGRWHPSFTDIVAAGNCKQRGIDEIIRHFDIPLEGTMAFGDGGNDISMLRHAGIGVAMGNASEEVKESADYVTASVDEDGIARALSHFNII